jgi:hypothetical protein
MFFVRTIWLEFVSANVEYNGAGSVKLARSLGASIPEIVISDPAWATGIIQPSVVLGRCERCYSLMRIQICLSKISRIEETEAQTRVIAWRRHCWSRPFKGLILRRGGPRAFVIIVNQVLVPFTMFRSLGYHLATNFCLPVYLFEILCWYVNFGSGCHASCSYILSDMSCVNCLFYLILSLQYFFFFLHSEFSHKVDCSCNLKK